MNAEELFIARLAQLRELAASGSEMALFDTARLIRQLLFDQHSLANTVNINKIKINFQVGVLSSWRQGMEFQIIEDGLDPPTGRPGRPIIRLNMHGFPKHAVIRTVAGEITIRDVVRYGANIAGGVHHDPAPAPEYMGMHALSNSGFFIGGYPVGTRQMAAIGRVVARALDPLKRDIESRQ